MANNYTSAMATVLADFLPVAMATSRVADKVKNFGTVRAKYVDVPVVANVSLIDAASNDITYADATTTKKTITINKHYCYPIRVMDGEQSLSPLQIAQAHIPDALKKLFAQMDADICALYTDIDTNAVGTFGAGISSDVIADAKAKLLANYANPEWLVVHPVCDAALAKDDEVGKIYSYQAMAAVQTGKIPNIHGFGVVTSPAVVSPDSGTYACLAFERNAFGIAFGDLTSIEGVPGREVTTITEPNSGMTVRLVTSAAPNGAGAQYLLDVQYGVVTLDKTRACLIRC